MKTTPISHRVTATFAMMLVALSLLLKTVSHLHWTLTTVTLLSAYLTIGFLPGLLLFVLLKPIRVVTPLVLIASSCGLSLGVVQACTIISLLLHLNSSILVYALFGSIFILSLACWKAASSSLSRSLPLLRVDSMQMIMLGLTLLVIGVGFIVGNGAYLFSTTENYAHMAIIERLSVLPHPSIDNIFYSPDFVYTYVFPGTHFFLAMVCNVTGLDPVIVFDKARFYWGLISLTSLYAVSYGIFRSIPIATMTLGAAAILVLSGPFANGPPALVWGQLLPSSHAADVAMNGLLPLLLVQFFYFVRARQFGALVYFGVGLFLMAVMIAIVHAREFVQFITYVACFLTVAFLYSSFRSYSIRLLVILSTSVLFFIAYNFWFQSINPNTSLLNQSARAKFISLVSKMPFTDFLSPLSQYVVLLNETVFWGLGALMLLLSPVVTLIFLRDPLVQGISLSIFSYTVVMRITPVAIVAIYLTYDEILYSPVRNFIFFLYLFFGAAMLLLYCAIGQLQRRWLQWSMATLLSAALGGIARALEAGTNTISNVVLFTTMAAFVAVVVQAIRYNLFRTGSQWAVGPALMSRLPRRVDWILVACLIVPLTLSTMKPSQSPLSDIVSQLRSNLIRTPSEYYSEYVRVFGFGAPPVMLTTMCMTGQGIREPYIRKDLVPHTSHEKCFPPWSLMDWIRNHLSPQSVLMMNPLGPFMGIPFLREYVAVPVLVDIFRSPEILFQNYYAALHDSIARHGHQPIFNDQETAEEKYKVLRALNASHILIDPANDARISPVLDRKTDLFKLLHREDRWAVYEILK